MTASVPELFRLDGAAAVVTGSGRGIGRGIALALAGAGADVLVTGRRGNEVEAVAGEVSALGRRGVAHPGDLRAAGFVEALAERAVTEFGRLDVWVNNAGGSDEKTVMPLAGTDDDTFRAVLELNLTVAFQGARAAARRMTRGGSIVNIASGAGMRAAPNTGAYGAAKAGLLNLTATMALELAGAGIRVNAVSPGRSRPRPSAASSTSPTPSSRHWPRRCRSGGSGRRRTSPPRCLLQLAGGELGDRAEPARQRRA